MTCRHVFVCVERKIEMGWRDMTMKLVGWASWVSFVWKLLSVRLNTNCWVQVEKQGRTREHRWIRHEERRKAHMTRVKWKKKKITNFKKRSLNSGTQNFIYFVLQWVGWLERERERISGAREEKVSKCSPNFLLAGFCCVTKIYWLIKKLFVLIKCAAWWWRDGAMVKSSHSEHLACMSGVFCFATILNAISPMVFG